MEDTGTYQEDSGRSAEDIMGVSEFDVYFSYNEMYSYT